MTERLVAACGLDCTECDIRRVPFDGAAAQRVVAWFHDMGWLEEGEGVAEVLERRMYCQGCHGDRSLHWSADCWILQCCVDEGGLHHCSQCDEFPCGRLEEWAGQNEGYADALARLKRMRSTDGEGAGRIAVRDRTQMGRRTMRPEAAFSLQEITEADIEELTEVMTRAFDDDAQKHLGRERGGPPGYDDGEFFRKWLFGYEESVGYKAVTQGRVIGAVIVWVLPDGNNYLGNIFVDPAYQDRGVGTRIWQFIEATYPQARSWTLGTPSWATKNHYFYEHKCGFRYVGTEPGEDGVEEVFMYRKEMGGSPESDG